MKYMKRFILLLFLLVICMQLKGYANAITPITNVFSKDFVSADATSVVLVAIILIEAFILQRSIKGVSFKRHLLFSAIINFVSSMFASFLPVLFSTGKFQVHALSTSILPLFIFTLIFEFPAIHLLYKNVISWKWSLWIDFKINFLSCLSIFIIQIIFLVLFSPLAGLVDKFIEKKWADVEVLNQERGHIYLLVDPAKDGVMNYNKLISFNAETKKLDKSYDIVIGSHYAWDISGNVLAYTSEGDKVSLYNFSDFSLIREIPGKWLDLELDKSGEYIALLEDCGSVIVSIPNERTGYYRLGDKCKIYIYSVATGDKVFEYDNFVLGDGFDWSPDSKKIIFVSYRDEGLFNLDENEIFESTHMLGTISRPDYYPKFIYVYDTNTKKATEITKGTFPRWSNDGKKILFVNKNKVSTYTFDTGETKVLFSAEKSGKYKWSLNDKNILARVRHKASYFSFFIPEHWAAIVNLNNNRKFIVYSGKISDFEWVE